MTTKQRHQRMEELRRMYRKADSLHRHVRAKQIFDEMRELVLADLRGQIREEARKAA